MAQLFEIPTIANTQKFTTVLQNVTYTFTITWRDSDETAGWVLDIGDVDNVPLACGIPLVTGINLLDQLQYLGIGGSPAGLIVGTDGDFLLPPTYANLGTLSHLLFALPDV